MPNRTLRSELKRIIRERGLTRLASVLYDSVLRAELAAVRLVDDWHSRERLVSQANLTRVTAIVKTFERPASLAKLMASARRLFPDLHFVIADDSAVPCDVSGAEVIPLPFDSGVSAGRKAALERVQTEFTWVMDDDFVFYRETRLDRVIGLFDSHGEIDLIGGPVVDLPGFRKERGDPNRIYPTSAEPALPIGAELGEAVICNKVPNFFVARTERLRLVNWTPEIKRLDHADFFTRACGVLATAYLDSFRCLHARTPFDEHYLSFRLDLARDREILKRRHRG